MRGRICVHLPRAAYTPTSPTIINGRVILWEHYEIVINLVDHMFRDAIVAGTNLLSRS
jgi:hypothetical protein